MCHTLFYIQPCLKLQRQLHIAFPNGNLDQQNDEKYLQLHIYMMQYASMTTDNTPKIITYVLFRAELLLRVIRLKFN